MNDNDIVKDFLVESYENLDRLDRDLVGLEKNPRDTDALAAVFRTIHTIKGTCGFLGFANLEKVAHVGENLLVRLRDSELTLNPQITTALLAMVDAVREMLQLIEGTGKDGDADYPELRHTLSRLQSDTQTASGARKPEESTEPVVQPASHAPIDTVQEAPHGVVRETSGPREEKLRPLSEESATQPHPSATAQASAAETTVRVHVNLLDKAMTLVGELVLARNQVLQYSARVKDQGLSAATQRLNMITTELQEGIVKMRMQPIGNIWGQFPRTVRDVALTCGKQVEIEMEGKDTELDKTIIEAIKDPLTHLVRNSVDHGIELPDERTTKGKNPTGKLVLRAFHEGGQVNIEIGDDGAGLDQAKIRNKAIDRGIISAEQAARLSERDVFNLIFLPGFSTAEKVTNVSGRGVGMDVVRTNVERIGGRVDIRSTRGHGTTVQVKIPLTLAIIPALVVTCCGDRYAIPQLSLLELVRLEGDRAASGIELVHGAPVYRLRRRLLPLVYLRAELQIADPVANDDSVVNIVVLQAGDTQFGLVVDQINDSEEIVVKPLRKQLKSLKTFAGSSIMGDGKVALILDVVGLAQRANVLTENRERAAQEQIQSAPTITASAKQAFLLFAGPGDSRMAVPLSTLARLEEFSVDQVEISGHQWVTQYRGQILPLVRLSAVLEERRAGLRAKPLRHAIDAAPIQVLVLNHQDRSFGLVVEQIIDIVEGHADVCMAATRNFVLHSVVIAERVTEVLDIPAILRTAEGRVNLPAARAAEVCN